MDDPVLDDASQTTATAVGPARARRPAPALARGSVVGRYVIVDFLDQGGMGAVYRAFDPELNRSVALKLVLISRDVPGGTLRGRLLREAQALAQLSHPNIVAVHDVGPYEDGVFMAMEYVEGSTLRAFLADGRRHPRAQVLEVMTAAGHGLAAAHQVGITHRDFKPANVILGVDGRVRVIDFGVARAAIDDSSAPPVPVPAGAADHNLLSVQLTQAGSVVGTPRYMAPEQHAAREATERSDQFSFCVVLFEALYGVHPFVGETREQIADHARQGRISRPPIHEVPAWLDRVVVRGLEPDPVERHPSMEALLAELGRDPAIARAQRRARLVRGGLVGVAVTSISVVAWLLLRPASVPALCPIDGTRLAGAWDDATRARIQARFDAFGRPYLHGTYPRVARLLDDHATSWLEARREACLATYARGEQSMALLDLRMACLDRRLGQLRELTNLFAEADAEVVEKAVQAAAALDPPAGCGDALALASRLTPPEAAAAPRVAALRERLARAEALSRAGKYQDAQIAVRPLIDEAAAVGYAPAQAEVATLVAGLAWRLGESEQAVAAAHDALGFAHASGYEAVMVKAYSSLIVLLGVDLERFAEAELAARLGDAVLQHLDVEGSLRFGWSHAVGVMWLSRGENTLALPHLEHAHALALELHDADHPEVARVLNNLGIVHQQLGDVVRARAAYAGAFAIFERSLGPDHPVTGAAHQNLGVAAFLGQDYAQARREYEAGARILEATLGPAHARLGVTLANLGEVGLVEQDHAAAVADYERALRILEAALGPDHPTVTETVSGLGRAYLGLGRLVEARATLERVIDLCTGDRCAASDAGQIAAAHFALAQVLWDGGDRPRALALARRALALIERATSPDAQTRAAYAAWLDARAPR